jgi:hypothetical protein
MNLVEMSEGNRPVGRPRHGWRIIIKLILKKQDEWQNWIHPGLKSMECTYSVTI